MKQVLLMILIAVSCTNRSINEQVTTLDSATIAAPMENKVITDTDDHNTGFKSEIALDSTAGKEINDTAR
jgi:hypothetical protein